MTGVNKVDDIKNERAREFHNKYLASFKAKYYAELRKAIDGNAEDKENASDKAYSIKQEYNAKLAAYVSGVEDN